MKTLLRFGRTVVYIHILGIFFSGLLFPLLSAITHPQPIWEGSDQFIQSYHWVQTLTFFSGFLLVLGSLLTFIILTLITEKERKIFALSGLAINLIFSTIVVLNYIIQITYVPYLARNNPSETEYVLAVFSMSNPGSLAWAFEMYGWGGIGLSFIFMAFIFDSKKYVQTLRILFLINGITSFGSAILTSFDMNWLFSTAGFASLIIWNLLIFSIDLFLLKYFRTFN